MSRLPVQVRPADYDDVVALADLWSDIEASGRLKTGLPALADCGPKELVERLLTRDDGCVLVAALDDRILGVAVVSVVRFVPFQERASVQIDYVYVMEPYRRRGIGHALVAAAAAYAEDVGAAQLTVNVSPLSREANRFFAQLGLTPFALRRVAPVTAVRRRIAILEHACLPRVPGNRRLAARYSFDRLSSIGVQAFRPTWRKAPRSAH